MLTLPQLHLASTSLCQSEDKPDLSCFVYFLSASRCALQLWCWCWLRTSRMQTLTSLFSVWYSLNFISWYEFNKHHSTSKSVFYEFYRMRAAFFHWRAVIEPPGAQLLPSDGRQLYAQASCTITQTPLIRCEIHKGFPKYLNYYEHVRCILVYGHGLHK